MRNRKISKNYQIIIGFNYDSITSPEAIFGQNTSRSTFRNSLNYYFGITFAPSSKKIIVITSLLPDLPFGFAQ